MGFSQHFLNQVAHSGNENSSFKIESIFTYKVAPCTFPYTVFFQSSFKLSSSNYLALISSMNVVLTSMLSSTPPIYDMPNHMNLDLKA
ncbi:hypothetical protein MTR_0030s0340 [Medicago truncatula]|uniref:Uncharacterized protein n=1 Tax=Medicago truncatula TaxID=3880 RepID=A0A072TK17_MEDTR|nr:hypothetical protein MTR_0030s0340 [Medicago truncatula]